jgi:acyl-CoA synthetase (AMP-forming)/AMP-acid ligase II
MNDFRMLSDRHTRALTRAGSEYELAAVELGGRSYPIFKRCPANMRELMSGASAFGEKTAIVYEDESWSYTRLYRQIDAIGCQLAARHGIGKGDRVAIAMRNYPEWLSVFCAIVAIGAVAVPINSWGKAAELEYGVADAGAGLVFCDPQRFDYLRPSLRLPAGVVRPAQPVAAAGAYAFDAWLAGAGSELPAATIDGDDLAMILYSSGTTGKPKGITWPHRTLTQAIFNFKFFGAAVALLEAEKIAAFAAQGFEPVNLLAVPLFHFNGLGATALLSIHSGQQLVMMHKWDVERALALIASRRVTSVRIAPAMALELLDSPAFARTDTRSLLALGSGGSATPSKLHRLIADRCPQVIGSGGYGTTETGIGVSAIVGRAYLQYPASAGLVGPLCEVRICGDDGAALPPGEIGEIRVRSAATAAATYWNRPADTAECFVDGWYRTGDVGYLDADGLLYITDRLKDMVIRGGENIYCVEVENAIYQYPGVAEVAAFGVPHAVLGEELAVAITAEPGSDISAAALRAHLEQSLAGYKVPAHFVFCAERLPRGPTGKILKRELRQRALVRS